MKPGSQGSLIPLCARITCLAARPAEKPTTLPRVYSSQGLKARKVRIKAGMTIGPERRRSRKCRAVEQTLNRYRKK